MKRFLLFYSIFFLYAFADVINRANAFDLTNSAGMTNYVNEADKPENLAVRKACNWGASTNGIRLGVGTWGSSLTVQVYLMTTNSQGFSGPVPAPHGYRLKLSLQDSGGKLMKRTEAGDALCRPLGWQIKHTMSDQATKGVFFLSPNVPRRFENPFNLLYCFIVEQPGTYTLHVEGALYKKSMTILADVTPMDIPVSSIQIMVTQADLDRYKISK
jgi:hypothetical protein